MRRSGSVRLWCWFAQLLDHGRAGASVFDPPEADGREQRAEDGRNQIADDRLAQDIAYEECPSDRRGEQRHIQPILGN